MIDTSKAKIYPAGERGQTETRGFRSFHTFRFGTYRHPHKTPFGALYVFNEDTLAGGAGVQYGVMEDSWILLLPTVGAITCRDSEGREHALRVGEAGILPVSRSATFEISNPYAQDAVDYLHAWIQQRLEPDVQWISVPFDLGHNKNRLIELNEAARIPCRISVGRFDGRQEAEYTLQPAAGLFVFVLAGAFEVQYRLLEAGDGLALWDMGKMELEALSGQALILLVEIPSGTDTDF